MSIKPLPGDVVAQIKSSVVVTSLNSVITGLIANSLDAQASRINISVDYLKGNCSVEDNGNGIPPSEFHDDGGLGRLHYTSKYPAHPHIYGKHGVFLASVASLSLLSITSHHRDFHSHNSIRIHNSRTLTRNTPCLPEQRLLAFAHGTRVTVRDLFGAMPVRAKHRALQAEKSSFTRDWDRLALDVVALLISWSGAVSVSIREGGSRQRLSFKTGSERRQWVSDSCRLLHQASFLNTPDTSNWVTIGASSPALSVSGYVCREPVATKRVQFISLGIQPLFNQSRGNVMYEEVNKVFADSCFGLVEDESDADVLPNQSNPDGSTQKELKARRGVDRWPMFFLKITPTTSATRSLNVDDVLDDRQPSLAAILDLLKAMFYEFLKRDHCRPRNLVLSSKPDSRGRNKNGDSLGVDETVSAASSRNSSASKRPRLASAVDSRDTLGTAVMDDRPQSPFAFWSKVKSGHPLQPFNESAPSRSLTQSLSTTPTQSSRNSLSDLDVVRTPPASSAAESTRPPLFDAKGKLTRKPFDDIDPRELISRSTTREPDPEVVPAIDSAPVPVPVPIEASAPPSGPLPQDETVQWFNPVTKMVTTINARTGFIMAAKPLTLTRRTSERNARGANHDSEQRYSDGATETTSWTTDLISKWKNPVFDLTEDPIPKLPDVVEMLGLEPRVPGHHCHHGEASFNMGTRHETTAMGLQGRLSKDTLEKAQLIAQVDKKFIIAKVSLDRVGEQFIDKHEQFEASSVLILIDQHAADERCRVESLMSDYFHPAIDSDGTETWKAVSETLPRPVQFELSAQDKDLLLQFQPYFHYWGIYYELQASAPPTGDRNTSRNLKAKVSVRSLPPAILERCRTDPRLLAELIRTEAWRLKDEDRPSQAPYPRLVSSGNMAGYAPVWVPLFHGCPPGILELVNSRSCRSAIMFNDPLTLEQCSDLLTRLGRCTFPFQCAHGRPSMVPLVDLGDGSIPLGNMSDDGPVEDDGEGFARAFKKWKQIRK
ncbi:unnamed protein product [Discula destructiva]